MAGLFLSTAAAWSITPGGTNALTINYTLHSYLGAGIKLEAWVDSKVPTPTTAEDLILTLKFYDSVYDDVIYQFSGTLIVDDEVPGSIASVAYSLGIFASLEILIDQNTIVDAVTASDAYNPINALAKSTVTFDLPDSQPPAFDAEQVFDILTSTALPPSYLTLPRTDDLAVFNVALRAAQELNIPLDAELDPTLTIDEACQLATDLSVDDHRLQTIWSPNECRPRDAGIIRGRTIPAYASGKYLGMKLLRNARTTSQGIPLIAEAVAGERYPFNFPLMKKRGDVFFTKPNLQKLAKAKVNVVREINFETGTKFVLSDALTHYKAKPNSALRLVNSAEILCLTFNKPLEILRKHMLRAMSSYLTDAGREIDEFYSKCASPTAGLLKPADDLDGRPYRFSLVPDVNMPFERVRFTVARRPEGLVRSVITENIASK